MRASGKTRRETMWEEWALFGRAFGAAEIWLAVAFLVSLVVVLLYKPQQIGNPSLFRLSYVLFALYIIVPSIIEAAMIAFNMTMTPPGMGQRDVALWFTLIGPSSSTIGKILLGISIICGLSSLKLRRQETDAPHD
jgi:hypothetical protein